MGRLRDFCRICFLRAKGLVSLSGRFESDDGLVRSVERPSVAARSRCFAPGVSEGAYVGFLTGREGDAITWACEGREDNALLLAERSSSVCCLARVAEETFAEADVGKVGLLAAL